jgi:hypothetical protein
MNSAELNTDTPKIQRRLMNQRSDRKWSYLGLVKTILMTWVLSFFGVGSALAIVDWNVNSWGSAPPNVEFQPNAQSCKRGTSQATSYRILSRGNGDSEVTLPAVLTPNTAYRFKVWLQSNTPTPVEIIFRRDDFPYETTAIQSVMIRDWTQVTLTGIHASSGIGSVRIALLGENVGVCIGAASLDVIDVSMVGAQLDSSEIGAGFFGVHLNRLGQHNGWPAFDPGTMRLWDTGTTWADLQPENGAINWQRNPHAQRLDYYVKHGLSMHRDLQIIYTLGMTPAWAGSVHPKNCGNSSYGPSTCTKPRDAESWRQYVRAVGLRYKGVIRVWEIWNEADLWFHWDQTPEELVKLAAIAKQELKSIDPQNQIIGPDITTGGLRFLSRFLKAGGGASLDGISIHAYLGRVPALSMSQLRNLRQMLVDANFGGLPIWNTETAVSCNPLLENCKPFVGNAPGTMSAENALAQGLLGNAGMGVKSFVFYTWEGASLEQGNVALVEADYKTTTKAGRMVSTIKAWLIGARVKFLRTNVNGVSVLEVQRGASRSLVIWTSGKPATFDLPDAMQNGRIVMAGGGAPRTLQSLRIDVGVEPVLVYPSADTGAN